MIEVELSPKARREVRQIAGYLVRESANAALGLRFAAAVRETLLRVLEFPNTGKRVDSAQRKLFGLRVVPVSDFSNYLIYYVPSDDTVYVLRVLHGARNLPRLMGLDR